MLLPLRLFAAAFAATLLDAIVIFFDAAADAFCQPLPRYMLYTIRHCYVFSFAALRFDIDV